MKKVENFKYSNDTKKGDCCPECKADWAGSDIYEHFLEAKFNPIHEQHGYYKDKTLVEIKETAGSYGWTEENPKYFGKVIGIDCSMDPDAEGDGQYDGISYWQCPECEVAWHRFKGFRTDKFVKSPSASALNYLNKIKRGEEVGVKMSTPEGVEFDKPYKIPAEYDTFKHYPPPKKGERQIIYNAIRTPDGTVISSDHGHDYVVHEDKNGKTYGVDGGTNYLKRIGDTSDCEDLSMYVEPWTLEFHIKAREVVKRGGRGIDGRQPLTWVPVCEMNDNWVATTIDYNRDRGMGLEKSWFTRLMAHELKYRKENNIKIEE